MPQAPRPRSHHTPRLPVLGNGFVAVRSIESAAIEALLGKLHDIRHKDQAVRIAAAAPAEGPSVRLTDHKFFKAMGNKRDNQPVSKVKAAIQSRQKSVNRPIDYASLEDIEVWQNDKDIFVGATFTPTTDAKLRQEQQAMLAIAADLGDGNAEAVQAWQPKALFAVIGKSAMAGTVSEVMDAVEANLGNKIRLEPVVFDTSKHPIKLPGIVEDAHPQTPVIDLLQFKRKTDRTVVGPEHVGVDVGADNIAA